MATAQTQAYNDWRSAIRRRIWPSPAEPKNLVEVHNFMFSQAMADLTRWCRRLQVNHTSVWPACATYVDRAMSLTEQPAGQIKRVYTIANSNWSDRVYYRPARFRSLEQAARYLVTTWTQPVNTGLPALQQGIKYAEAASDSPLGRSRVGIWAKERNRLYAFPWMQSNESLVVEWDGLKTEWGDADVLDLTLWTSQHADAVEHFVRWREEFRVGTDVGLRRDLKAEYDRLLADLMALDLEQTKTEQDEEPEPDYSPEQAEVTDDAVPAATGDSYVFAYISDFGYPLDVFAGQVATMVKAWQPRFIVTGGDNMQPGNNGATHDYATAVGQFYSDYIGHSLLDNRLWPTIGNHDYDDPTNGLADYLAYFPFLPGNQRYYDFIKGPVHFFIVNATPVAIDGLVARDPDGFSETSVQGKWLKVKLKLSTSPWNVVIFHYPPYTTFGTNPANKSSYPGSLGMRWPFKDWGAHLVLSGHNHVYERFLVDGMSFIVAGTGGGDLVQYRAEGDFPLVADYLQARYNAKHGALYCTASCTALDVKFVNTDGTVIDTVTLTKLGTTSPTVPAPVVPAAGATPIYSELQVRDLTLVLADGTKVRISAKQVEDAIQLGAVAI